MTLNFNKNKTVLKSNLTKKLTKQKKRNKNNKKHKNIFNFLNIFILPASQPLWIPMLAGATARTIAVTIVSPLELIRTKMQSKKLTYAGIVASFFIFHF